MNRKPMTQNDAILDFLKNHPVGKKNGITANTAFEQFGVTSLSRRICDLQERGYRFEKHVKRFKNRYGNPSSATWYKLIDLQP